MTISHVQSANGGSSASAASCSATFAATVGSGNLITGFAFWPDTGTTGLASISDDKGNTYTIVDRINAAAVASANRAFASFYCANVTNAPKVITANFSPSQSIIAILVDEYSGVATTSPLDGHAMQVQNAVTTASSGNITTTQNGDLIYGGAVFLNGLANGSAGTGFTLRIANVAPNGAQFFCTEDEVQSAAGSIAASFGMNQSDNPITGAMAFSPVGGAGGGIGDTLPRDMSSPVPTSDRAISQSRKRAVLVREYRLPSPLRLQTLWFAQISLVRCNPILRDLALRLLYRQATGTNFST